MLSDPVFKFCKLTYGWGLLGSKTSSSSDKMMGFSWIPLRRRHWDVALTNTAHVVAVVHVLVVDSHLVVVVTDWTKRRRGSRISASEPQMKPTATMQTASRNLNMFHPLKDPVEQFVSPSDFSPLKRVTNFTSESIEAANLGPMLNGVTGQLGVFIRNIERRYSHQIEVETINIDPIFALPFVDTLTGGTLLTSSSIRWDQLSSFSHFNLRSNPSCDGSDLHRDNRLVRRACIFVPENTVVTDML